ncbi:hypothetical protein BDW62DRAFT_182806 [Aspergillus aurantiobrunneus]
MARVRCSSRTCSIVTLHITIMQQWKLVLVVNMLFSVLALHQRTTYDSKRHPDIHPRAEAWRPIGNLARSRPVDAHKQSISQHQALVDDKLTTNPDKLPD